MSKTKKLIVDLDSEDAAILRIMRHAMQLPASVIVRWSLRWYARKGPVALGSCGEKAKDELLAALAQSKIVPFIQEVSPCEESLEAIPPAPQRGRPKASKRGRPARRLQHEERSKQERPVAQA